MSFNSKMQLWTFQATRWRVYNNIIVEWQNEFVVHIRYKSRNIRLLCHQLFSSSKELKNHKREAHSY
jgi:hypothetical protein